MIKHPTLLPIFFWVRNYMIKHPPTAFGHDQIFITINQIPLQGFNMHKPRISYYFKSSTFQWCKKKIILEVQTLELLEHATIKGTKASFFPVQQQYVMARPLIFINNESQTQTPIKKRRGGEPRKCLHSSCDRIVTKRNYCYRCQKRKERGISDCTPISSLSEPCSLPGIVNMLPNNPKPSGDPMATAPVYSPPVEVPNTFFTSKLFVPSPSPSNGAPQDEVKISQLHSYLLQLAGGDPNEAIHLATEYLDYLKLRSNRNN